MPRVEMLTDEKPSTCHAYMRLTALEIGFGQVLMG